MSFLDKFVAAITPPESDEDRATARHNAEILTSDGDWLAIVIEHHRAIETAFADAVNARDAIARGEAMKRLQLILTGHANAEETVLYPALARNTDKLEAGTAYEEQAMTKIQLAKLETLDPMSNEWLDQLEHIRGAVVHHIYQEESSWFPKLQQHVLPAERPLLTTRFIEEFERYAGVLATPAGAPSRETYRTGGMA